MEFVKAIVGKLTNATGSLTAVLAAFSGFLAYMGHCAADAAAQFGAKCDASWLASIDPRLPAIAAGIFGVTAVLLKIFRSSGGGFTGVLRSLLGSTAVVVPPSQSGPGVVTSNQVRSP